MKKFVMFVVMCAVAIVYAGNNSAEKFPVQQKQAISLSLVNGLNSGVSGLKVSSALKIFELVDGQYLDKKDFAGAVIPLMKMLKAGNKEVEKIAAALALNKIDNMPVYLQPDAASNSIMVKD